MRHARFALLLFLLLLANSQAVAAEEETELRRSMATSAPRPEYPFEARRAMITGAGIVVMEVDPATGVVTRAYMRESTGSVLLDQAALNAFRRWVFKPGTVKRVVTPITFTRTGRVTTTVRVDAKPMDEMLAAFLGKGTVVKGPMPQYPRSVPWIDKQGQGVYELHVDANGNASQARVLKPSGDPVFDNITVAALRKWRLRRGPLVIELPLSFTLTPTKYSVAIPKNR